MSIVLITVCVLLGVFFLGVGFVKATLPIADLRKMPWTDGLSSKVIRAIGVLEVLGGLGLIIPTVSGFLPWLSVLASLGLAVVMLGATLRHVRIGDARSTWATTSSLMVTLVAVATANYLVLV